jgi:hypothetical protein
MLMRFDVKPGQRVLQSEDEPEATLMYDGVPDWVTLPEPLGGGRANVVGSTHEPCPCGQHDALVLLLDAKHGDKQLRVAECAARGFLWHTKG